MFIRSHISSIICKPLIFTIISTACSCCYSIPRATAYVINMVIYVHVATWCSFYCSVPRTTTYVINMVIYVLVVTWCCYCSIPRATTYVINMVIYVHIASAVTFTQIYGKKKTVQTGRKITECTKHVYFNTVFYRRYELHKLYILIYRYSTKYV